MPDVVVLSIVILITVCPFSLQKELVTLLMLMTYVIASDDMMGHCDKDTCSGPDAQRDTADTEGTFIKFQMCLYKCFFPVYSSYVRTCRNLLKVLYIYYQRYILFVCLNHINVPVQHTQAI